MKVKDLAFYMWFSWNNKIMKGQKREQKDDNEKRR